MAASPIATTSSDHSTAPSPPDEACNPPSLFALAG